MASNDQKIYLLPNLMTAGNLFCGFAAILLIFDGMLQGGLEHARYYQAILLILAAFVFDILDGRLARFGGTDSAFGREFDSLADIVSFGVAPSLLVFEIVLRDFFDWVGWLIAFFYLVCGALRLARFNCMMADSSESASKDFLGFPIPAAAGLISSITLWMLWMEEGQKELGNWKYALPALMIFLSLMMFSHLHYPSFKALGLKTKRTIPTLLVSIIVVVVAIFQYQWMLAALFVTYLLYGVTRPWLSKRWRQGIEKELGEEEDDDSEQGKSL